MSTDATQTLRAIALQQAVAVVGKIGDAAAVINAAEAFNDFLNAAEAAPVKIEKPATKPATKPDVAAKPVKVEKAATKPAKVEAPVEAAAPSDADRVESLIGDMLKANKRKEAIALLASFEGAKTKSGIIEQGPEVMTAFIEGAEAILLGA
jgi:hypothetical protein